MDQGGKPGLNRPRIFTISLWLFIAGIGLASLLPARWADLDLLWFGLLLAGLVISIISYRNKKAAIAGFFILAFFLGLWRYSLALSLPRPDQIRYYNGTERTFVARVNDEPEMRDTSQRLRVRARSLAGREISGQVLLTIPRFPEYRYGDELELSCRLERPSAFAGFAYDKYLARYRIFSLCYYPQVRLIGRGHGSPLYSFLFDVKDQARLLVNRGLAEPRASLARAITLGDKRSIPEDVRQDFARSGLMHIAAISGMHISVIVGLITFVLLGLGLPRRSTFLISSAILAVYILVIGAPVSAMRAGLMGFLVLWALSLGRLNRLANTLILAAAILLLFNPRLLRDDIGWQLSFLAVAGIAWGYPRLRRAFRLDKPEGSAAGTKKRLVRTVAEILLMTGAIQLFTWPIGAVNFGLVSLVSPLANLLAVWMLPFLLLSVLAATLLSFLYAPASPLFFAPAGLALDYISRIAHNTAALPGAFLEVDYLGKIWIFLYYIILAAILAYLPRYKPGIK